jgi:hypothetical protein
LISISYPNNHLAEKKYIFDILLGEFLGLDFEAKPDAINSIISITLENGNRLNITDSFFSDICSKNESYLQLKYIPSEIFSLNLNNSPEDNIIGLYGTPNIKTGENEINCGLDIFASAFYMLTRWEEYVIKDRDIHERFPSKCSLAYQKKFLSRPIVNEYTEVIWHWLSELGIRQKRKERKFKFINTHDIDRIYLFENNIDFIAKPIKALLVDKTISSLVHHAKLSFQSFQGKDPYLSFDYFMDSSERYNIKSHFFFMATKEKTKYDNGYNISDATIKKIIKNIIDRGHTIGIHPSYHTLNNPNKLYSEINSLRETSQSDIICGRQHYLRFKLPNTWGNWNNNKMQWDSSLAYPEQEGFRCGVCYSFSVFDILTRKKLKLKEKPLIIMDATLQGVKKLSPDATNKVIHYYYSKVKKYSGDFVFLWHNSSFSYLGWKNYRKVYEDALNLLNG